MKIYMRFCLHLKCNLPNNLSVWNVKKNGPQILYAVFFLHKSYGFEIIKQKWADVHKLLYYVFVS
jgi:hypothetical protein